MKKILLLGSGELGKEFTIAAKRAGQYVIACDHYDGAPAMQVADEHEVIDMLDGNALEQCVNRHKPDIIVPKSRPYAPSVCLISRTAAYRSYRRPVPSTTL